jgi:hypothetical protein
MEARRQRRHWTLDPPQKCDAPSKKERWNPPRARNFTNTALTLEKMKGHVRNIISRARLRGRGGLGERTMDIGLTTDRLYSTV